jgi:hypothetical protein
LAQNPPQKWRQIEGGWEADLRWIGGGFYFWRWIFELISNCFLRRIYVFRGRFYFDTQAGGGY